MSEDGLREQSSSGTETEELKARIEQLEGLLEKKETELKVRDTRLSEVEAKVAEMEQAVAGKDNQLTTLGQAMIGAVARYKALVVQANPDIPGEMISGDSIEALDSSLESARVLVKRVRESIEGEIASGRVPVGSPARVLSDTSALSPREKIQYAFGGKK